jgi:CubicO group peptidase (beta-lactamase class C family)
LLHLRDGVWQGERILPEGWVEFVSTPAPAARDRHYGGLFRLNAGGSFARLPLDMYWAAGHHGQSCFVIPSRDLVVVRLGHSGLGGYDEYIESVLEEILDSTDSE